MNNLLKKIPKYYEKSVLINSIFNVFEKEFERATTTLNGVASERFINSADNTLKDWEREFAVKGIAGEPKEHRRSKIVSKLRGQGTVTREIIKNVSESYANGDVDVIEYPKESRFIVKFVGIKGIPPNLSDLANAINDCKPAHLAFDFAYTYNTWGLIEAQKLTWQETQPLTWEEITIL